MWLCLFMLAWTISIHIANQFMFFYISEHGNINIKNEYGIINLILQCIKQLYVLTEVDGQTSMERLVNPVCPHNRQIGKP